MNAAELKQKAKDAARMRSQELPRQTSSASTSNQSELTQKPPNLYQVSKINVPPNMEACARLLQIELSKVAESQSIMLTLWEELQQQKQEINQLRSQIAGK